MKTRLMILFALAACTSHAVFAQPDSPHLSVERLPGSLQLSWPSTTEQANGSILRPWFELQRSIDLQSWKPMGERFRATAAAAGELYRVNVDIHEPRAFYRLLSVTPPGSANLGAGGAEVFGYEEAFARELESIGQISAAEFAEQFASSANYLPAISRNPTNAAYWNAFNADIAVEHGTNRFVCAGPVLSHYEFEVTGSPRRISDTEWKVGTQLGGDAPPYNLGPSILNGGSPIDVSPGRIEGVSAPVWTRGYLVPKR